MKSLNQHLNDYLKLRRQLGYKLQEAESFLRNFIRFIEQEGTGVITAKLAVRWATRPNLKSAQNGSRLRVVRGFAAYVSAHDSRQENLRSRGGATNTWGKQSALASFEARLYVQLSTAYPLQTLFRFCQGRLSRLAESSG
jgi:hypothetical protein